MALQTLHGSCACGRNRYVVEMPAGRVQQAELRYDNTVASRLISASPATIVLRVPLDWYTSATFAQHADESRQQIQRSFVSPFAPHTRRKFCGYCGTQLSSWTERTSDDAEHISLTVGSLLDEDQERLRDLGLLPSSESSDLPASPRSAGAPWFEEMVQNTVLGRFKQQRGAHTDNGVLVEWDVVEWTEGDQATTHHDHGRATPSKRKVGNVDAGDDTDMAA
ncbi:hypothetical protein NX059_009528 [Plenodomus lindquistii]|nr:hypothetical protein NX059_009528 [Plenodomus lindquistii]